MCNYYYHSLFYCNFEQFCGLINGMLQRPCVNELNIFVLYIRVANAVAHHDELLTQ